MNLSHCLECKKKLNGQKSKKYCDHKCQSRYWKKLNLSRFKFVCQNCGGTFGRSRRTFVKYCSTICANKTRAKNIEYVEKIKDSSGYVHVRCPNHPKARWGRIVEHRLVVEEIIGRILGDNEYVHHKDGIRDNNHPDNLLIVTNKNHSAATSTHRDRAKRAECFISQRGLWEKYLKYMAS